MGFFYNIGMYLFNAFMHVAALFNHKARLWVRGRRNWYKNLISHLGALSSDKLIWFHASSLGEFEQGRPVMELYHKNFPEHKILLTFFSPSGYEVRKDYAGADYICYLPVDTAKNARRFITLVKPAIVIFIKYEFWYNILKEAYRQGARSILISSIFRPRQIFFRQAGGWYRRMLFFFNHIFVQDSRSFDLLRSVGLQGVSIAGDTRFDRVVQIADSTKEYPVIHKFSEGFFTIVCGSTWPEDEELLCQFINQATTGIRFIIAPHEITDSHINAIDNRIDKRIVRYSRVSGEEKFEKTNVLIIDNIGMLSSVYKYGHIAYVGGGFGAGIHNILEAAVFALPVLFGPNHTKFREALAMIDAGGAFPVNSFDELKSVIDQFRADPRVLPRAAEAARNYVNLNTGATDVIMKYLINS